MGVAFSRPDQDINTEEQQNVEMQDAQDVDIDEDAAPHHLKAPRPAA